MFLMTLVIQISEMLASSGNNMVSYTVFLDLSIWDKPIEKYIHFLIRLYCMVYIFCSILVCYNVSYFQ